MKSKRAKNGVNIFTQSSTSRVTIILMVRKIHSIKKSMLTGPEIF